MAVLLRTERWGADRRAQAPGGRHKPAVGGPKPSVPARLFPA